MGNVGIIGRARVGKDTAGAWLVEERGYRRIGFADVLKDAALKLNPIVWAHRTGWGEDGTGVVRLSELVRDVGWERGKETPEVRRTLQELGMAIRAVDPDFWLRAALTKVQAANEAGVPVVITDVRFPNEAESLRRAGFHLVYVHRPDVPHLDHESEGALTMADADHVLVNDDSLTTLLHRVEVIAERVSELESRRHFARSLS